MWSRPVLTAHVDDPRQGEAPHTDIAVCVTWPYIQIDWNEGSHGKANVLPAMFAHLETPGIRLVFPTQEGEETGV